ncbi:MAG: DUF5060 domain-containing protein [Planctomycetota bacterium]
MVHRLISPSRHAPQRCGTHAVFRPIYAALCLLIAAIITPVGGAASSPPESLPDPVEQITGPRNIADASDQSENPRDPGMVRWDSFESDTPQAGWSVDAAGDPAEVSVVDSRVSHGEHSLRLSPRFMQNERVLLRRNASLNVDDIQRLKLDIHASADDLRIAFAYKDEGDGWHQSDFISLDRGWNRDVECTGEELRKRRSDSPYSGETKRMKDFYAVIEGREDSDQVLHLDNLRLQVKSPDELRDQPPSSLDVFQPTRSIGRRRTFEVGVQFEEAQGNLFDPDDVRVRAEFEGPDGRSYEIAGFMAGYADSDRFGQDWPIFLVRFSPPRTGRWTFRVRVETEDGEIRDIERWFYVTDSRERGPVQVSRQDRRFFEFENGDFFYPLGQNVAWTQDYGPYFERMETTGQNWVRIWMCPWNLQLETAPGRYDLKAARRLDRIIEMARDAGIQVQLVLIYHGMLTGESWDDNPYNRDNDGPCFVASSFFTGSRARELFKKRLDYVVARWGHATNLFAWELFNEVDLTRYRRFDDIIEWHREMSDYLKDIDPYDHMVTTSLSENMREEKLWELPNIDFMPLHAYEEEMEQFITERYDELSDFNKPWFVAEYAISTDMAEVKEDIHGENLRDAMWATALLPTAGNVMSWWWDSYIMPHELNDLYIPLARFTSGMDRRNANYRLIDTEGPGGSGGTMRVKGLLNNRSAYLWLRGKNRSPGKNSEPNAAKLHFNAMLGGEYELLALDTETGKTLRSDSLSTEGGELTVQIPNGSGNLAIRIRHAGDSEPDVRFWHE